MLVVVPAASTSWVVTEGSGIVFQVPPKLGAAAASMKSTRTGTACPIAGPTESSTPAAMLGSLDRKLTGFMCLACFIVLSSSGPRKQQTPGIACEKYLAVRHDYCTLLPLSCRQKIKHHQCQEHNGEIEFSEFTEF